MGLGKADSGGILTPRRYGRWRALRRAGAVMGVLALLLQCLVVAVHQPAQAGPLLPFQDPAAWCGTIAADDSSQLPDPGAPRHARVVCPICTSLQAAGPGLLPVQAGLVVPLSVRLPAPPVVADTARVEPFGRLAANPRAPPSLPVHA
jgi:hypothetical protein